MLQRVSLEMPEWEEAAWFLKLAKRRLCDPSGAKRGVYVLGRSLPEELFLAFGISPVRLLGGSSRLTEISDCDLPRDIDPVTRAVYGYLTGRERENALIVIPLADDSSRKLAGLLKRKGKQVYPVAIPPEKNPRTLSEWKRQMELLAERLSSYTGRRCTERQLRKTGEAVAEARRQVQIFDALAGKHDMEISGIFRMFLPFCYYLADDPKEWTSRLGALNHRLSELKEPKNTGEGRVLLFGSPIYFPNDKVLFLLKEAGLSFGGNFILSDITRPDDGAWGFDDICRKSFFNDNSAAYVNNETLFAQVSRYLKEYPVNGVVYHVLKGQIEYDFELERFERLFSGMDIPVIRLETDYHNQDVEQLRLRIEAFSEMLSQRKKSTLEKTNPIPMKQLLTKQLLRDEGRKGGRE